MDRTDQHELGVTIEIRLSLTSFPIWTYSSSTFEPSRFRAGSNVSAWNMTGQSVCARLGNAPRPGRLTRRVACLAVSSTSLDLRLIPQMLIKSRCKGYGDQHVHFCFSHPQYDGKHVVEKRLDTCNLVPSAKFPDKA